MLQNCNLLFRKHQFPTSAKDRLNGDEGGVYLLRELSHGLIWVLVCVGIYVGLEGPRLGEQGQGDWKQDETV